MTYSLINHKKYGISSTEVHKRAETMLEKIIFIKSQVRLLAAVMRGFFRPTLSKTVRSVVSAQLRENNEFHTHRFPVLLRAIRWIIGNPLLALIALFCAYLVVFLSRYLGLSEGLDPRAGTNEHVRDYWTVNLAIFSVQAALIGVVFPLVIAFVGLLNQGRASFASRLTVYIDSSAALFVGVSSLFLCASIALQIPFGDEFVHVSKAVTVLNISWFAVNVAALGYFLLRTIAFLHPSTRAPIMRSYVANEIWPRELSLAVTANQWTNVSALGHLPAGDEADPFSSDVRARVWYTGIWKEGEASVTRRLPRTMKLIDVRFGVLKPAVDAWLSEVRQKKDERVQDLVIPLEPGRSYAGDQVLARATVPLNPVSRAAVKLAFRFSTQPTEQGRISATNQIFSELIADLIELIDERRAGEFAEQLREVEEFHIFLYRLAQSSDINFSYAQLDARSGMFSRSLTQQWTEAYRDITRRVVERLPEEPEFVRPLAYIPYRIYARASGEVASEALRPIIQLGEDLSHRMVDWAVEESRAEAASGTGDRRAFSLSRQGEAYARAWREQVAGWEALLRAISSATRPSGSKANSWRDLKLTSENAWVHLRSTTQMTARAVWLGDVLATSWTSDLMLRWETQLHDASIRRGRHRRIQSEALTPESLQSDWEEIVAFKSTPGRDADMPPLLFEEIVHNTWRDHAMVLAAVFIHWSMHTLTGDTAKQGARMLLHGEQYDRGDRGLRDNSAITGVDFLISALRIVGSGSQFSEGSYAGRIDRLLEGLGRLGEMPKISMRIYTSGGGLAFSALPPAQAIALMATTPRPPSVNGPLRRLLTQGEDEALRRKKDYLTTLASAIEELDSGRHSDLVAALVDPKCDDLSFGARQDHARQFVAQSLSVLNGYRDQAILDAKIDNSRIDALASAAASKAFSKDGFPRHLFDEIIMTNDHLEEFSINVDGLNKGEYTTPQMGQAPLNEEEWWRETLSDQVSEVVWSDVIRKLRSVDMKSQAVDIESQTPHEFWEAVRDCSALIKAEGYDPLLVMDDSSRPEWLFEWQWPDGSDIITKPRDLVITNEADQASSYEFTMNSTPVYRAKIEDGVAYLISSRLLEQLRFHDYGEGRPVEFRFDPDVERPWSGTMRVTFEREIKLATNTASYRISWGRAVK
ncbi:hypothetical protein MXB90_16590 [Phaeovulum sp. NW3]|nr:hypothetical protein [Phaeovulum sp. NW3]